MKFSTEILREAYTGYCKQQGVRAANVDSFGKACAEMFGPRKRLSKRQAAARPWGYQIPDGETWQKKIDERLGILDAPGVADKKGETDKMTDDRGRHFADWKTTAL